MSKLWRHGLTTGVRVADGKWTVVSRGENGWSDATSFDLTNALGEAGVVGALDRMDITRDGKRAAFTVSYGDAQFVQVVDTESGATVRMIGVGTKFTETNFGDVRFSPDGRVLICTYPYAEDASVNRVMVRLAADDYMTTFADVTARDAGASAATSVFGARLAIVPQVGNDRGYIVSALSLEPRRIFSFRIELDESDASVVGSPAPVGLALAPARNASQWGLMGVDVSADTNALVVTSATGVDVYDVKTSRLMQSALTTVKDLNDVVASCENGRVTVSVGSRVATSGAAAGATATRPTTYGSLSATERGRRAGAMAEANRVARVRALSPKPGQAPRATSPVARLRALSPTRYSPPKPATVVTVAPTPVFQPKVVVRRSEATRDGRSYAHVVTRAAPRLRALSPSHK